MPQYPQYAPKRELGYVEKIELVNGVPEVVEKIPYMNSVSAVESGPSLGKKAYNFGKASVKHVANSRKHATDEQVLERFAICSSNRCGFYRRKNDLEGVCIHKDCGCNLRTIGVKGKNKLRWASERCPVKEWEEV